MNDLPRSGDPLRDTEEWFARHGLVYFVPEERAAVRAALTRRRAVPLAVLVVLLAGAAGAVLVWLSDDPGSGPALLLTIAGLAVLGYALTALRARPILAWALQRAVGSLARVLPMMSRALPLLLLFVTFLFINAEVWEMTARLSAGALWLTVLLFAGIATAFLLVRLPEEVDRVDDHVDAAFLQRACRGTPLEASCAGPAVGPDAAGEPAGAEPAGREPGPAAYAEVSGIERWNLIVALLIVQAVQVLMLAVGVFAFFVVFGSLVMTDVVQQSWTGVDQLHSLSWLPNVSGELIRVSLFLASFSGLYLTVSTVTDETYREQFFSSVVRELERAVGVRAVYRWLRSDPGAAPG